MREPRNRTISAGVQKRKNDIKTKNTEIEVLNVVKLVILIYISFFKSNFYFLNAVRIVAQPRSKSAPELEQISPGNNKSQSGGKLVSKTN